MTAHLKSELKNPTESANINMANVTTLFLGDKEFSFHAMMKYWATTSAKQSVLVMTICRNNLLSTCNPLMWKTKANTFSVIALGLK